jgi:ankyrin repeat protein
MTTIEDLNKLLVIAIINNQESECERLIKIGADINYLDKTDINLLNIATMYFNYYNEYNFNIIKLLVDAGCDINVANFYGNTPIMISIMFPRYEVFEYLLQKDANVNHKNCNLQNVLFFVVRFVNKSYKLKYSITYYLCQYTKRKYGLQIRVHLFF